MSGFKRLPNHAGSVTKRSEKLRKPWRVRKAIGTVLDEKTGNAKVLYKNIGYFATKKEALEALYHSGSMVSSTDAAASFRDVYTMWAEEKYPTISDGLVDNYKRCFKVYAPLHERMFRSLNTFDYETVIGESDATNERKRQCRILLGQMYHYALRHEICEKNYAELVEFHIEKKPRAEKKPFTVAEVEDLWKKRGDPGVDMVLVGIYSGFRPTELLQIDVTRIKDGCFVGGIKTENGKNRLVPIHPSILPIVEEYTRKSAKIGVRWLFPNAAGTPYDLCNWRKRVFDAVAPNHTPHEMRHTFATYARRSGMDPMIVKKIMGHAITDLTEGVYTHLDPLTLCKEMSKFSVS